MAAPTAILPPLPQTLAPHDASWLNQLRDSLALIEAELWDELHSEHPGARHRITDLRICAADRRRQLAALGVSR